MANFSPDMSTPITLTITRHLIEVTQEDIDLGVRGRSQKCPIARAILRKFPDSRVTVSSSSFSMMKPPVSFLSLPAVARGFIEDFDLGRAVAPISFFIETPNIEAPHEPAQ